METKEFPAESKKAAKQPQVINAASEAAQSAALAALAADALAKNDFLKALAAEVPEVLKQERDKVRKWLDESNYTDGLREAYAPTTAIITAQTGDWLNWFAELSNLECEVISLLQKAQAHATAPKGGAQIEQRVLNTFSAVSQWIVNGCFLSMQEIKNFIDCPKNVF